MRRAFCVLCDEDNPLSEQSRKGGEPFCEMHVQASPGSRVDRVARRWPEGTRAEGLSDMSPAEFYELRCAMEDLELESDPLAARAAARKGLEGFFLWRNGVVVDQTDTGHLLPRGREVMRVFQAWREVFWSPTKGAPRVHPQALEARGARAVAQW